MRIPTEEYRQAVGILKRYNYNCLNIMNIQSDILSLSVQPLSDMPRAPYSIGDTTFNKVMQLQNNKDLQRSITEYKIVAQALQLVSEDSKLIFEEIYRKGKTKWLVMETGMSQRTFERRKKELIDAVNDERKKVGGNLAKFYKNK